MTGSPPVTVTTGNELPRFTWDEELSRLTDAPLYSGPTWLAGAEAASPDLKPWHTVATRYRGETAILPGYVVQHPTAADLDPRTYLGWIAGQGGSACCGSSEPAGPSAEIEDIGVDGFFPALVLGSPSGYRTEVSYNFWTPSLMASLVRKLVPAAFESGVRSVVAPWIVDRAGNQALADAFRAQGGHTAYWGSENYLRLDAPTWDDHLAALPPKVRKRIRYDLRKTEAAGVRIDRVDGDDVLPLLPDLIRLSDLNGEKNNTDSFADQIGRVVPDLVRAGTDIRAYLGYLDGDLVGMCVGIRKRHSLYLKWTGFDYAKVGEKSGIYFSLTLNTPVKDAYDENLRAVEFGGGAFQAKQLRGCLSRSKTTAVLLADEQLRERTRPWLDAFGEARRAVFGSETPSQGLKTLPVVTGGCCGS